MNNKKIVVALLLAVLLFLIIYIFFINNDSDVSEKLVVSNSLIEMEVGTEEIINAFVTNNSNAKITYQSTDDSIVNVSQDGIARALKVGDVTIVVQALSSKGEQLTVECKIATFEDKKKTVDSVAFNGENLVIQRGNTFLLNYAVTPEGINYQEDFKSSNENVVSVTKDGLLEAKEEGQAVITLTINDTVSTTLNVFVTNKIVATSYVVVPSSIYVLETNISLHEGEEKELKYQITPDNISNDLINYIVADNSVVEVHDGIVKGLKSGETDVIIESVNNIRQTIHVLVKSNVKEAESIRITSEKELTIKLGQTSQITYTVEPSDATSYAVTFQSADSNVLQVSSTGLITPVHTGETSVIVTLNNGKAQEFIKVKVSSKSNSGSGACNTSYPEDSYFNSCFKSSKHLIVSSSSISIPAGGTATVKVTLPNCGTFIKYTRQSADGGSGWRNYVSQSRSNISSSGFTWIITAKPNAKGKTVLVSQTIQYDAKSPSGTCIGNVKSMKTITVKIT